jgi:hypothetical protein
LLVLGIDNDREYGQRTACPQYASHSIGQQKTPDSATSRMRRSGEPTDEGGRDGFVPGKLAADFLGQVIDHQGQRTETVEAHNTKFTVDAYKHPRNVSPFILAGSVPKPPIELLVSTGKRPSLMPFSERLDEYGQSCISPRGDDDALAPPQAFCSAAGGSIPLSERLPGRSP